MGDARAGLVHGSESAGSSGDLLRQPLVPVLGTHGEPSEHDGGDHHFPQLYSHRLLHGTLLIFRLELPELRHRRVTGPLQVGYLRSGKPATKQRKLTNCCYGNRHTIILMAY